MLPAFAPAPGRPPIDGSSHLAESPADCYRVHPKDPPSCGHCCCRRRTPYFLEIGLPLPVAQTWCRIRWGRRDPFCGIGSPKAIRLRGSGEQLPLSTRQGSAERQWIRGGVSSASILWTANCETLSLAQKLSILPTVRSFFPSQNCWSSGTLTCRRTCSLDK